ncbi:hypothetical protein [Kordiimonas sp.]|uniref:hypothetical protein n=1 Tax=Kordiimonas sp. TaxID=1970157 RepID=UPI003A8F5530
MNTFFMTAGITTLVICSIHCWFGGRYIAEPLLRARDIHEVPKYTNYYCWHLVTLSLIAMAAAFIWAALSPEAIELAVLALALSITYCLWNLALILWKKQSFRSMPQWSLFFVSSLLGVIGFSV